MAATRATATGCAVTFKEVDLVPSNTASSTSQIRWMGLPVGLACSPTFFVDNEKWPEGLFLHLSDLFTEPVSLSERKKAKKGIPDRAHSPKFFFFSPLRPLFSPFLLVLGLLAFPGVSHSFPVDCPALRLPAVEQQWRWRLGWHRWQSEPVAAVYDDGSLLDRRGPVNCVNQRNQNPHFRRLDCFTSRCDSCSCWCIFSPYRVWRPGTSGARTYTGGAALRLGL